MNRWRKKEVNIQYFGYRVLEYDEVSRTMWSALNKVGALVDKGINSANQFLEELDRVEEGDEDGEVEEDEKEEEGADLQRVEAVGSVNPAPSRQNQDSMIGSDAGVQGTSRDLGRESAKGVEEEEEEEGFFTPLKVFSTIGKKAKPSRVIRASNYSVNSEQHDKVASSAMQELEHAMEVLKRENEKLKSEFNDKRIVMQKDLEERDSELERLQGLLKIEAENRAKLEAEVVHVKKVGISPKTHKESLKMIEILKRELSEFEAEKEKLEANSRREISVLKEAAAVDGQAEVTALKESLFAITQELERSKLELSAQRSEQAEALAAAVGAQEELKKIVTSLRQALSDAEARNGMLEGEISLKDLSARTDYDAEVQRLKEEVHALSSKLLEFESTNCRLTAEANAVAQEKDLLRNDLNAAPEELRELRVQQEHPMSSIASQHKDEEVVVSRIEEGEEDRSIKLARGNECEAAMVVELRSEIEELRRQHGEAVKASENKDALYSQEIASYQAQIEFTKGELLRFREETQLREADSLGATCRLQELLAASEDRVVGMSTSLSELEAKLRRHEGMIDEIRRLQDTVKTLEADKSVHDENFAALETKLTAAQHELLDLKTAKESHEQFKWQLESLRTAYEEAKTAAIISQERVVLLEKELEAALTSKASIISEMQLLEEALQVASDASRLESERNDELQSKQDLLLRREEEARNALEGLREDHQNSLAVSRELKEEVLLLRQRLHHAEKQIVAKDEALMLANQTMTKEMNRFEVELQQRIIKDASLNDELKTARDKIQLLEGQMEVVTEQLNSSRGLLDERTEEHRLELLSLKEQLTSQLSDIANLRESSGKLECIIEDKDRLQRTAEKQISVLTGELSQQRTLIEEKEMLIKSLQIQMKESEDALSLVESKKRRDLDFLRKQNETIATLQRQLSEEKEKALGTESESVEKIRAMQDQVQEASKQSRRLTEALNVSQAEVASLRKSLDEMISKQSKAIDVELLSNYADSPKAQPVASNPTGISASTQHDPITANSNDRAAALEAALMECESRVVVMEEALQTAIKERDSLKTQSQEAARKFKALSTRAASLDEERLRLEGELLACQRTLADMHNSRLANERSSHRANVASPASYDVESATVGDGNDESDKKGSLGYPWALLFAWSVVAGKGGDLERKRLIIGAISYLLIVHILLLRAWSQCVVPHSAS